MDKVVHFEIPADDTARAKEFYGSIFDWQLADADMGGGNMYTTLMTVPVDEKTRIPTEPGAINGGMLPRGEPVLHPIVTITVDDVDSALATIESLGGKAVVGRTPAGAMGFTGYAKDTEGNVIGLWESAAS